MTEQPPRQPVIVIGAGITGLALALELRRRDVDVLVLEALDRPGGVIRSAEVEGRILDWGPQRIRLTREMAALVDTLGLEEELVRAPRGLDLYVYRDGRLRTVPFTPREFLTTDLVSLRAKLRLLIEPFTAPADPTERVAACFRRKLGDEMYEAVVAPLYGGLYGSDPADMEVGLSLGHVLRKFGVKRSLLLPLLRRGGRIDPPPACTFRNGMRTLPRAMGRALGDRLRLESPVTRLDARGAGWRVHTPGEVFDAAHVVVTVPAPAAADLLREAAPEASGAIRSLRYNRLAVVHLDAQAELSGLGFQVAFTEPNRGLRGVTFNDSMFGRADLYTAYLGGARSPEVTVLDDSRVSELAVNEFRRCTGYDARPLSVERERIPAWDMTWSALRGLELPSGLGIAANWWSRPGIPGRLAESAAVARRIADPEPGVAEPESA